MDGIAGKVVAITGASSGIGEATARLLASRGAMVVLGARGVERLDRVSREIAAAGGAVATRATDVRRRPDLMALVDLALDRFGRLDVLVANAGSAAISQFDDLKVDDWDDLIDTNLKGVLNGIAAALPVFRRQNTGHFVHVASTAAHRIVPPQTVYAAAKTAVRVVSEGLRQEAGPDLRVTVISPGFVRTGLASSMPDPAVRAKIQEQMDRIAIPPEAIARAIAFAIEQPPEVDVGEIVVRPTAQG